MQFKHPEILYALFALLIPIFIHLFQLQRFVKIPFTNVRFLKEIELQTRKSSRLKKWLILMSRMAALAAMILAFAQPYFSKSDTAKDWETIIFIDNSISLQAKSEQGALLKRAAQDVMENVPSVGSFSLMTHDQFQMDLDRDALKEALMLLDYSNQKSNMASLIVKIKQHIQRNPNKNYKVLWISDFQKHSESETLPDFADFEVDFIPLHPKLKRNLAIDSVYVSEYATDYQILTIRVQNQGEKADQVAISAFQKNILLAKTNVSVPENQTIETTLRVSGDLNQVKLVLNYEDTFPFDNTYYIAFQKPSLINVLLATQETSFLNKIYTDDEFKVTSKSIQQVSFESIDENQLIVMNEVAEIPSSLHSKLLEFVEKGGSLTLIPNATTSLENLNALFSVLKIGTLQSVRKDTLSITKIHFSHPLLERVFEKEVTNFQYPDVNTYFVGKFNLAIPVLSFADQSPFIAQFNIGAGKVFWVAAPMQKAFSNFTSSPLVVPVFYNMGKQSVLQNQLSYRIGTMQPISVSVTLHKDEVLTLVNGAESVIPAQQIHEEEVILTTGDQPQKEGFYQVQYADKVLQSLAFNIPKEESRLAYWNVDQITTQNPNTHQFNQIKSALTALSDTQNILTYFKWFMALALLFLLIEIALIKYM
ncbi:MAG: BatA domain-containing protein [Flavobacteriaceae bacterium]|nr:BatA domain-containing protein [Flavobacteriaceae bacterium]